MGEKLLRSKFITKVGIYFGISDGKFGSSVGISVGFGYGKLEVYPLGEK